MKTLLALFFRYGEYEDKGERLLAVSADRAKLDEERAKHEADLLCDRARRKAFEDWSHQYHEEHPYSPFEVIEKYPRWESGLRAEEITAEMRAERKAIVARNTARAWARNALMDEWSEKYDAAALAYMTAAGIPEEEQPDVSSGFRMLDYQEYSYSVEEVHWLE